MQHPSWSNVTERLRRVKLRDEFQRVCGGRFRRTRDHVRSCSEYLRWRKWHRNLTFGSWCSLPDRTRRASLVAVYLRKHSTSSLTHGEVTRRGVRSIQHGHIQTIRTYSSISICRHYDSRVRCFARRASVSLGSTRQSDLAYECGEIGLDGESVQTCVQSRGELGVDRVLCFDEHVRVVETQAFTERDA